jgi:molybdate transport system substrate-binding protein
MGASLLLFLTTLLALAPAQADEVKVAVAANFLAPAQKLAQIFAQDTGHQVRLTSGSTGSFYAQIRNGAPFQVLLAADAQTPQKLIQEGWGVAGSRFTYATGKLVLWSLQAQGVDAQGEVLRTGAFLRLALANPKLSPYGAAAVETLHKLGLWDGLQAKIVQGENIAQTYQFIATENAALGFVALSQVSLNGRLVQGAAWLVPSHLYAPLRQDALLLLPGRDQLAARAWLAFLKGAAARALIRSYGYEV